MARNKTLGAAALGVLGAVLLILALCSRGAPRVGGGAPALFANPLYKKSRLPDPVGGPAGYDPVNDDPRDIPEQYARV